MKISGKKLIFASLAVSFLMTSALVITGMGKTDKIAVAANGATPTSMVGNQAGRSPFFLIFDEKGTFVEAIDNPYKDRGGGIGVSMVDFLAGKGVTVIVAEAFGPRIVEVMKGKGIRAVDFKGSAGDAAKKALSSK